MNLEESLRAAREEGTSRRNKLKKAIGVIVGTMVTTIVLALITVWVTRAVEEKTKAAMLSPASAKPAAAPAKTAMTVVKEVVAVDAPYGRDGRGEEIYSEPVEVMEGRFSYGFREEDSGTGCLKVKVSGKFAGKSCPGRYLDLATVDGGGKKVKLQFAGEDRTAKLFVERPVN